MNLRLIQNIAIMGFGFWGLTACNLFRSTDQDKANGKVQFAEGYVTHARLEARRLGLVQPEIRQGMSTYENCEVLTAELNESARQRWIQQKANISDNIAQQLIWEDRSNNGTATKDVMADSAGSAPASTPEAASGADTLTNVQEAGVDEADRFKIGRDQIYVAALGKLQVINRATLQQQGSIDVSSWYGPQIFTKDDRLVIIGTTVRDPNAPIEEDPQATPEGDVVVGKAVPASTPGYPGNAYGSDMKIAVYQTAPGTLPVLLKEVRFKGNYTDSRLVQNQLVTVIRSQISSNYVPVTIEDFADEEWYKDSRARERFQSSFYGSKRESDVKILDGALNGIPCNQVVKRKVADWDTSFTKVFSLNITAPETAPQSLGIVGQGEQLYMTPTSLYLLKSKISWFDNGWSWYGTYDEKLQIQQIGFDGATGNLLPLADGEVSGRIKDRWALHGMNADENLVIATSTGTLWASSEDMIAQNHLYVLGHDPASQRLTVVGSVENFGTREDIRAVRYVDNIAYVVTFRQTDPLFAFDIADAKAPKLLSGLKVPGFSTYMHPLAPGRLLGVGFDAFASGRVEGVQVSLFDTSDPMLMSRLDNKLYGSGGSNSEITRDHHAFFFDPTSQLIGIPLVELVTYGSVKFSGAQLLQFDGSTLIDRGRISHREWIPSYCQQQMAYGGYSSDINRLFRVDNRLISLSSYGMKAFAFTDFIAPVASVQFLAPAGECDVY